MYRLQQTAYNSFFEGSDDPATFDQWRDEKCKSIPQFKYWDIVLNLELLLLEFVRAERTADFSLYMKVLPKLAPWFFALDHTNYARWLPVHIKDLLALEENNPALYKEFQAGHFVARKSCNSFSAIALDHAHEQMNGLLKNEGGKLKQAIK